MTLREQLEKKASSQPAEEKEQRIRSLSSRPQEVEMEKYRFAGNRAGGDPKTRTWSSWLFNLMNRRRGFSGGAVARSYKHTPETYDVAAPEEEGRAYEDYAMRKFRKARGGSEAVVPGTLKGISINKGLPDMFQKASSVTLDIEKGDVLLGGRFKNIPHIVRKIGTDELGQPTVNGMKLLSFRIKKKMQKKAQDDSDGSLQDDIVKLKDQLVSGLASRVTGLTDPVSKQYAVKSLMEALTRAGQQSYRDKGALDPSYFTPEALKTYISTPLARRGWSEAPAHGTLTLQEAWKGASPDTKDVVRRGSVQSLAGVMNPALDPVIGGVLDAYEGWRNPEKHYERVGEMRSPEYTPVREGSVSDFAGRVRSAMEPAVRPAVALKSYLGDRRAFTGNYLNRLNQAAMSGASLLGLKTPVEQDLAEKDKDIRNLMAEQDYPALGERYGMKPDEGISYLNSRIRGRGPQDMLAGLLAGQKADKVSDLDQPDPAGAVKPAVKGRAWAGGGVEDPFRKAAQDSADTKPEQQVKAFEEKKEAAGNPFIEPPAGKDFKELEDVVTPLKKQGLLAGSLRKKAQFKAVARGVSTFSDKTGGAGTRLNQSLTDLPSVDLSSNAATDAGKIATNVLSTAGDAEANARGLEMAAKTVGGATKGVSKATGSSGGTAGKIASSAGKLAGKAGGAASKFSPVAVLNTAMSGVNTVLTDDEGNYNVAKDLPELGERVLNKGEKELQGAGPVDEGAFTAGLSVLKGAGAGAGRPLQTLAGAGKAVGDIVSESRKEEAARENIKDMEERLAFIKSRKAREESLVNPQGLIEPDFSKIKMSKKGSYAPLAGAGIGAMVGGLTASLAGKKKNRLRNMLLGAGTGGLAGTLAAHLAAKAARTAPGGNSARYSSAEGIAPNALWIPEIDIPESAKAEANPVARPGTGPMGGLNVSGTTTVGLLLDNLLKSKVSNLEKNILKGGAGKLFPFTTAAYTAAETAPYLNLKKYNKNEAALLSEGIESGDPGLGGLDAAVQLAMIPFSPSSSAVTALPRAGRTAIELASGPGMAQTASSTEMNLRAVLEVLKHPVKKAKEAAKTYTPAEIGVSLVPGVAPAIMARKLYTGEVDPYRGVHTFPGEYMKGGGQPAHQPVNRAAPLHYDKRLYAELMAERPEEVDRREWRMKVIDYLINNRGVYQTGHDAFNTYY